MRFYPKWALLAAVFVRTATCHGQPSFTGVGDLPGGDFWSVATAVSADGASAVGHSWRVTKLREPFLWTPDGGMEGLGHLDGESPTGTWATGVSTGGSVVVGWSTTELGTRAFRWTLEAGMLPLGDYPLAEYSSHAQGVSAGGAVVVGFASSAVGKRGFRWTEAEGMTGLGDDYPQEGYYSLATAVSADGSAIGGYSGFYDECCDQPFIWTAGTGMVTIPLPFGGGASAISGDGSAIAGRANQLGAYRWTADQGVTMIEDPSGDGHAFASNAVSGDGSVVVGDLLKGGAFWWTERGGTRDLRELLLSLGVEEVTAWTLGGAAGVSADGRTVVGTGTNPDGNVEGWVAVLPPPCPADFNDDFTLDLFDFLHFVNLFNAGHPGADCEGDGDHDLFDFLCFQNLFNAGC